MHIPFVSKTKNRCRHQTKDGAPCKATPQAGKPYCFFHDPERAEDRTAARRQGGLTSIGKFAPVVPPNLPRLSLKTPEDVGRLYEDTINQVLQGQMDLRTANVIRFLANGLLRTLATLHRHQRDAAKATLPGKRVPEVHTSASRITDPTSTHQLENGNSKLTPPTLPDKGVPRTENNDNQTPDWLLKLQEESMAKIAQERSELKPGVPHSRPSASGKSDPQGLPGKGVPAADSSPRRSIDSPSQHQLETGNSKLETVLTTPVRDPDNEPSPIPGLLNRHLNYLKFAGMPVPESQRKRFHIPQAYVSSMSARKVEFEINSALRKRNRPR